MKSVAYLSISILVFFLSISFAKYEEGKAAAHIQTLREEVKARTNQALTMNAAWEGLSEQRIGDMSSTDHLFVRQIDSALEALNAADCSLEPRSSKKETCENTVKGDAGKYLEGARMELKDACASIQKIQGDRRDTATENAAVATDGNGSDKVEAVDFGCGR
jgi:hypothetical protein